MAIVKNNDLTEGFSGAFGKQIVFKQVNGKTIATKRARKPQKESALQRQNRDKFQDATHYARRCMLDADKKAYYKHKAKKLGLTNAYTAAITDYMRNPRIAEVDTTKYKGKAGDCIAIKAAKDNFPVKAVNIVLQDAEGQVLETASISKPKESDQWLYKTAVTVPPNISMVKVLITVHDFCFNSISKEIVLQL